MATEPEISDLELLKALSAHNQGKSVSAEEAVIARIRRQMREQDQRKHADPNPNTGPILYVVFVWRKKTRKWKRVAEVSRTTQFTPKALATLRKRFRKHIADDEIMRVVEARVVQQLGGAGGAPQMPPARRRPSKVQRRKLALVARRQARQAAKLAQRKGKARPTDRRLSKCEIGRTSKSRKRCPYRAPWYVAFTDGQRHRRVVRRCCTRHAWDNKLLPSHAKHVVRIERKFA